MGRLLIAALVAAFAAVSVAAAGGGEERTLVEATVTQVGEVNLGGRPANVFQVYFVGAGTPRNGFLFYDVRASIHAAPADDGRGEAVLYEAPGQGRWRDAIAHLTGISTSFADLAFPQSLDNEPFPPLRIRYTYRLSVDGRSRRISLDTGKVGSLVHRPLGELQAGTYEVDLETCADLAPHRLKSLMSLAKFLGTVSTAQNFFTNILGVYGFAAETAAKTTFFKNLLKAIGLDRRCSTETYEIVVPATVPKLLRRTLGNAEEFVRRRHLVPGRVPVRCTEERRKEVGGYNRVVGQTPKSGKLVDPGTTVRVGYCAEPTSVPTPKPAAGGPWHGDWSMKAIEEPPPRGNGGVFVAPDVFSIVERDNRICATYPWSPFPDGRLGGGTGTVSDGSLNLTVKDGAGTSVFKGITLSREGTSFSGPYEFTPRGSETVIHGTVVGTKVDSDPERTFAGC